MKIPSKILAGAALFVSSPAIAATDDFQVWTVLNLTTNVATRVPLTVEFAGRFNEDASRLGVAIFRPAIGYKLSDAVTVFLGYAHQTTINDGRADTQENRIFQQVNWRIGKIGRATVNSRSRFEQRFIDGSDDLGWRVRERIQGQIPLREKGPNFVVSTEIFVALNSTDWGARSGFDQVRTFVGVSVPLSKALTLETGYQNRYQVRRGAEDRIDHIVPITLNVRF